MIKRFLKKISPEHDKIREHKSLRFLRPLFANSKLWQFNRHSVSRAVTVGIFCAFLPIPFQMIVAAIIAVFSNANLPLSVGLVWLSNPLTIPPIFYFTYKVGTWLMGSSLHSTEFTFTTEWLSHHFNQIWQPLLVGSLFCGVVVSVVATITVKLLWNFYTIRQWRSRGQKDD